MRKVANVSIPVSAHSADFEVASADTDVLIVGQIVHLAGTACVVSSSTAVVGAQMHGQYVRISPVSSNLALSHPPATVANVYLNSDAELVNVSVRPIAIEQAMRTERLNNALKLGYTPALRSTVAEEK